MLSSSLAKTCDKLGIAFWDYLGSRFKVVAARMIIEPLDHYVRARSAPPDRPRRPHFCPCYERLTAGCCLKTTDLAQLPVERRPAALLRQLQMVFQNPDETLNPAYSVGAQLARAVHAR